MGLLFRMGHDRVFHCPRAIYHQNRPEYYLPKSLTSHTQIHFITGRKIYNHSTYHFTTLGSEIHKLPILGSMKGQQKLLPLKCC